jgi:hypothetical protein
VAKEGAVALERINFGRRQVEVLDIGLDADLPSDEIECEVAISGNVSDEDVKVEAVTIVGRLYCIVMLLLMAVKVFY